MIEYRDGFNYEVFKDYKVKLSFGAPKQIKKHFVAFSVDGWLEISKGYSWDGPSGPTIDTKSFMRGSLVHDVLYQLMRQGDLDIKAYRDKADLELKRICLQDGMTKVRAWWVYKSLRFAGRGAALPSATKRINRAP
jgi:hypothetical protein